MSAGLHNPPQQHLSRDNLSHKDIVIRFNKTAIDRDFFFFSFPSIGDDPTSRSTTKRTFSYHIHLTGPDITVSPRKERPDAKPRDIDDDLKRAWKKQVSKMLYPGIKGDYLQQAREGRRVNEVEHNACQHSLHAASKTELDFESMQCEAISDTNRNPQAQIYHPKYQEACDI